MSEPISGMIDKKAFRVKKRAEIKLLPESYIKDSDARIAKKLSSLPEFAAASRIFAYYSIGNEVDTHWILKLTEKQRKTVFLPVVRGNGLMEFALFDHDGALRSGALHIPEPAEEAMRAIPQKDDIILVPGLCYDAQRYRLGQGGGYYDRFLADCPAVSIGIGRERLMPNAVPRQPHDLPVDVFVTEARVFRD